jgi:hypothetical protein
MAQGVDHEFKPRYCQKKFRVKEIQIYFSCDFVVDMLYICR